MLSNAHFLAKFRFDTAENEPAKNLQNFQKMHFRKCTRPAARPAARSAARSPAAWACRTPAARRPTYGKEFFWTAYACKISRSSKMTFCKLFANFWPARSRLYQNKMLQVNMRLTTSFFCAKLQ